MNIRFKIADNEYRLTSDKYQVFLDKVGTIEKGENAGNERFYDTKCYPNEFMALESLIDSAVINEDFTDFKALGEYRRKVIDEIRAVICEYSLSK